MSYVLDFILDNKENIKKDIIRDIKEIQKNNTSDIINVSALTNKIDAIKEKKLNLINLRTENEIARQDFVLMNDRYDMEIAGIMEQIEEAKSKNNVIQNEVDTLKLYIKEVENILDIDNDADRETIYREILHKIIVYQDRTLEIYLKCLPVPLSMKFFTTGRVNNYKVWVSDFGVGQRIKEEDIEVV